ncbi:MAG: hypothetical protein AB1921_07655 [Thermodesulfobacteriota bacterium]
MEMKVPPSFRVEQLLFEFPDGQRIPFKPSGTLYFDDWTFNIFSPDYRYVVLMQDRYGPYHVVPIKELRDYLTGKKSPFEAVSGSTLDIPGVLHGDVKWKTAASFEFCAACCSGSYKVFHQIGGKTEYGKWRKGERAY